MSNDSPLLWLVPLWLFLVMGWGWAVWAALALTNCSLVRALPDGGLAWGRCALGALAMVGAFWLGHAGVAVAWLGIASWLVLALLAALCWRQRQSVALTTAWRRTGRGALRGEWLFLSVFALMLLARGFWSDTDGTNGEKGMDSALIAVLARSHSLPPPNPYSAGVELRSYYYGGHLSGALATRASGTTTRWSYNLLCATLPALIVTAFATLAGAWTRGPRARFGRGALAAGLVMGLGTLQPIFQWLHPDAYSSGRFLRLDAFATSRVIPFTINEYPFFTFFQGDLHAHYFSMALQMALVGAAWMGFTARRDLSRTTIRASAWCAVVLAAIIITNSWDFPTYALLGLLALGLGSGLTQSRLAPKAAPRAAHTGAFNAKDWRPVWWGWALGAAAIALALGLSVLFWARLSSVAGTPLPLEQPASPARQWLLLWGVIAAAWLLGVAHSRALSFVTARARWAALGVVAALIALEWARRPWGESSWLAWSVIVLALALALALMRWGRGTERFLGIMALCGLFALAWSEATWAGFLGNATHAGFDDFKRQDTVFKFGMQAWLLWGGASAVLALRTLRSWPEPVRWSFVPFLAVMAIASLSVAHLKTRGLSEWQALDAWAHLSLAEQRAASWLERNVAPGRALLEAENREGGDYSQFTRYAHATGIPTLIGPMAHSFQWSPVIGGKIDAQWAEVGARKEHARFIYTGANASGGLQLLELYGIDFVVWGDLERREYGEVAEAWWHTHYALAASFADPEDANRSVAIFHARRSPATPH